MIDLLQLTLRNQYEATLSMFGDCVAQCNDATWWAPVASLGFNQVAFHTLFFTDLYLGPDVATLRLQPFHAAHTNEFADYEELEPRLQQQTYSQEFIFQYLSHCREKASVAIAAETPASLALPALFDWLDCTRLELHFYNIRHLQHHAAQLSLRLRLDADIQIQWVKRGWQES